jgi:hypothetical protein
MCVNFSLKDEPDTPACTVFAVSLKLTHCHGVFAIDVACCFHKILKSLIRQTYRIIAILILFCGITHDRYHSLTSRKWIQYYCQSHHPSHSNVSTAPTPIATTGTRRRLRHKKKMWCDVMFIESQRPKPIAIKVSGHVRKKAKRDREDCWNFQWEIKLEGSEWARVSEIYGNSKDRVSKKIIYTALGGDKQSTTCQG